MCCVEYLFGGLGWWFGLAVGSFVLTLGLFVVFLPIGRRYLHAGLRAHLEDLHATKGTTPTMGGLVLVTVTMLALLAGYMIYHDGRFVALLLLLLGSAAIGGWDDICKIFGGRGISLGQKFVAQIGVGIASLGLWYWFTGEAFPQYVLWALFPVWPVYLGVLGYSLWALWVMLSTYNCVNFTDGLDGLAGGVLAVNFLFFGLFALLLGDYALASVVATVFGGLLAFLWFNLYPARVMMGDVGSLSFGSFLAMIALMLRIEIAIVFVGIIFVIEGVSVILQITWIRLLGRRLFLLAPLHHHFEKKGYSEVSITTRSILITVVMACATFAYYLLLCFC